MSSYFSSESNELLNTTRINYPNTVRYQRCTQVHLPVALQVIKLVTDRLKKQYVGLDGRAVIRQR